MCLLGGCVVNTFVEHLAQCWLPYNPISEQNVVPSKSCMPCLCLRCRSVPWGQPKLHSSLWTSCRYKFSDTPRQPECWKIQNGYFPNNYKHIFEHKFWKKVIKRFLKMWKQIDLPANIPGPKVWGHEKRRTYSRQVEVCCYWRLVHAYYRRELKLTRLAFRKMSVFNWKPK